MRTAVLAGVLLLLGGGVRAQEPTLSARVVEIAGVNLYLDAGAASGLVAGDTLAVRRSAAGTPVGAFVVVAVSERRALAAFAGPPFPVTRGEVLLLVLRRGTPVAGPPAPAPAAAPRFAAPARPRPLRLRGSAALEVEGSRTTTVGFGADPERLGRDFAIPSLRLYSTLSDLPGGGRLVVSLRASQQTGTTALFDRSSVLRVYDAHYDQEGRSARLMVGRFFGPYEPFSGSWDGALVRVGGRQGLGAGIAAGFQPDLGVETVSTDVPKLMAFAGFRRFGSTVRFDATVSAHAWRPRDGTADRTFLGWSQRLSVGSARLDHLVEVDRSATGGWNLTRLDARVGVPLGRRLGLSAEYFRDRLGWWATGTDSLLPARERLMSGVHYAFGDGYLSADVGILLSGSDVQGRSYGAALRLPEVIGSLSWSGSLNYWTIGTGNGLTATPALAWRLGRARPSLAYEFFRSSAVGTTTVSHGGYAALSLPLAPGVEWLLRVHGRFGQNLRSSGVYSGLRIAF